MGHADHNGATLTHVIAGFGTDALRIRLSIWWRKGSFGTESGIGARFAGAMLMVAATCRMHGLDLIALLAEVCTASMAGLAVSAPA